MLIGGFSCLFFETGSQVAQAGLTLSVWWRRTLNFYCSVSISWGLGWQVWLPHLVYVVTESTLGFMLAGQVLSHLSCCPVPDSLKTASRESIVHLRHTCTHTSPHLPTLTKSAQSQQSHPSPTSPTLTSCSPGWLNSTRPRLTKNFWLDVFYFTYKSGAKDWTGALCTQGWAPTWAHCFSTYS